LKASPKNLLKNMVAAYKRTRPNLHDLWEMPRAEFQYLAGGFTERLWDKLPAKFTKTIDI